MDRQLRKVWLLCSFGALVCAAGRGRPGRVQLSFSLAFAHPFCLVSRVADERESLRSLIPSESFKALPPRLLFLEGEEG